MTASDDTVVTGAQRLRSLVREQVPADLQPPAELRYRRRVRVSSVVADLWRSREILRTLAERDLRVRYKQAVLGFAWALLTPLALLAVFTVVFGRVAKVPTGGMPYASFAYVGLLVWTFFSASVASGGVRVLNEKALLNKCYFPREVFPLSSLVVAGVDGCLAVVPLLVLLAVEGLVPGAMALLLPLPLLVLVLYTAGVTLAVSSLVVYVRDIRLALPLVLQVGLFVTPVAYALSTVPEGLRLLYVVANPLGAVVDTVRRLVLLDTAPDWPLLGAASASAVVVFLVGYGLFKRLESGFADVA